MPELMSLDDSSYDELYERAMERLRIQAPWWTHTEVSDPGIMLIEMWALLSDMQSYYLDQVQQSHYRKYLKLLGIPTDEGECAWTWAFFGFEKGSEKECIVPKGTKLLSDRMVFETEEEVRLIKNRLQGFYLGNNEDGTNAMKLSRKNRFALEDSTCGERILFTLVLNEPLKPGEDFSFFVLLDERGNRNSAKGDLGMVRLIWEYQVSNESWREVKVVRDDTAGLLFSGIVILRIGMPSDKLKCRRGSVRCRIRQGEYDVMPALYKIYLNVVKVVQKDTLCCEENVEFTGECHRAALKSYLARTGRLWILKEIEADTGDGGLWEDITEDVRIDDPVKPGHMERYVSYDGTGRVKIVCAAAGIVPEELIYQVTGIAAQRISLPWKKLMRSSVKLMVRQEGSGKKQYRSCGRVDPEEDRYRNVWHWDEEENIIVLGDGRHGEIPSASEEGLRLTAVCLWEGDKGNVPVDRITKWQQPELFPGLTCTNYLAGRDGRSRKEPSVQFEKIKGALSRQNRMVTEADISQLAMETPGLMIRRATAEWKDNTVVVSIFPTYSLKDSKCAEWYKRQVEKHLESYRLAGTKMKVEIRNDLET